MLYHEFPPYIPDLDGFIRALLAIGTVGSGAVSVGLAAFASFQIGWYDGRSGVRLVEIHSSSARETPWVETSMLIIASFPALTNKTPGLGGVGSFSFILLL